MSFELPPLPYPMDALAPHISKETLFYHHDKHHAGYVNKLNALIKDTEFESMSLKQIIQTADGAIFNNAAQVFNHTFYWYSLWPQKNTPSHDLHEAIERDFGSMERFVEQFSEAAVGLFGSGWCWLTMDEERKLNIEATRMPTRQSNTKRFLYLLATYGNMPTTSTIETREPDTSNSFGSLPTGSMHPRSTKTARLCGNTAPKRSSS